MFQVTVFCEDNKLQKVMWALDGIVVGVPQVIPVRGAKAQGGKVVATQPGTLTDRLIQELQSLEDPHVSNQKIMAMAIKAGSTSKKSAAQIVHLLLKRGIIERIAPRNYTVVKK